MMSRSSAARHKRAFLLCDLAVSIQRRCVCLSVCVPLLVRPQLHGLAAPWTLRRGNALGKASAGGFSLASRPSLMTARGGRLALIIALIYSGTTNHGAIILLLLTRPHQRPYRDTMYCLSGREKESIFTHMPASTPYADPRGMLHAQNLMPWYRTLSWMAKVVTLGYALTQSPSLRASATWINLIPIDEAPCRGNRES